MVRMMPDVIHANWPAAGNIHAFCTRRYCASEPGDEIGGGLKLPYGHFNLAQHVGDDPRQVESNRRLLCNKLNLPSKPVWLNQVHGIQVADAQAVTPHNKAQAVVQADASFSKKAGVVCSIMTADCLPVLICNRKANKVAAVHAGWRGLAAGVIEASIAALQEKPEDLLVWFGPAIGPDAFEVGAEVREVFVRQYPQAEAAFKQNRAGHFLADIYHLARIRLKHLGLNGIYGGDYCTYSDPDQFYSYRRDNKTGRMASLIWFDSQ